MVDSKSTDKIKIMQDILSTALKDMPESKMQELEELAITWDYDPDRQGGVGPVPQLKLKFMV